MKFQIAVAIKNLILSRLALKIVVIALGKRQEARVKKFWAILLFFTQIGFIVFTYLKEIPDFLKRSGILSPFNLRFTTASFWA